MLIVRTSTLSSLLGLSVLGAGCPSPSPTQEDDGTSSTESTAASTDSTAAASDGTSSTESTAASSDGTTSTDSTTTSTESTTTSTESTATSTDSTATSTDSTATSTETSASTETSSETSSSSSDTGVPSQCGNGLIEAGEACDDGVETATCNADCTPAACGDGIVNAAAGEQCEGDELAGGTCEELGFEVGTLACDAGCSYDVGECYVLPAAPVLTLSFSPIKRFDFTWIAVPGADHYQLLESAAPGEPYVQLGGAIVGESVSFERPLHLRWQASYVLQACNVAGCTDSMTVDVMGSLVEAVGYVKASNTGALDLLGHAVALSGDGNTLAVGAYGEDGNATGIDGNQANDAASSSGAVYVFARDGLGNWSQQAYVKASNTGAGDQLGWSLALSDDGSTLAVGAFLEDGSATGIGGNQADDSATNAGAVYVLVRDGAGAWSQQAYVKASNTGAGDLFGQSVALSGDGSTLAVGATDEDSNATGIGGNQANESAATSGAVYVFVRDGAGAWSQQAYAKASNAAAGDGFGVSLALSADGSTLAVGAISEDSSATGIGGNQGDNAASNAGAVYVLVRDGAGAWSQQAYVKASNTATGDLFGESVALSGDGSTLAVSATLEDSSATGIGGNQADNGTNNAGAVYVFVRDGAGAWSQQAYVKASNPGASDLFGESLALSASGDVLAVGAYQEGSSATGLAGNQADNGAGASGAVYVLVRDGAGAWSQQAYVKASNTGAGDAFGFGVALADDGATLAASARDEGSNATGIGGNQANDAAFESGAVYLF